MEGGMRGPYRSAEVDRVAIEPLAAPLGAHVRDYAAPTVRTHTRVALLAFALVILAAAFGVCGRVSFAAIGLVAGLVAFFAAFYLVGLRILASRHSVHLYQEGLVVRRGRRLDVVPWAEVDAFYVDVATNSYHVPTSVEYTLVRHDGSRVRFGHGLQDAADLYDRLQRRLSAPLVVEANSAIADGETLTFGSVKIHRDFLSMRGRTLAWSDVRDVRATPNTLFLYAKGRLLRWGKIAMSDVPHPSVFMALLRRKTEVRALEE
jgi:hypothetical protein